MNTASFRIGLLSLLLAAPGAPPKLRAQTQVFGRLEGGTLSANDPLSSTLAFGATLGVTTGASSFAVRVVRQSWNRNGGSDVNNGRTFALLDWELASRPSGEWKRQAFLRLGAGWLFQRPFTSTAVADAGVGLRYQLVSRVILVGAVVDQVAWVQKQVMETCQLAVICTTTTIPSQAQHNVGLMVAVELRP